MWFLFVYGKNRQVRKEYMKHSKEYEETRKKLISVRMGKELAITDEVKKKFTQQEKELLNQLKMYLINEELEKDEEMKESR